MGTLFLVATPIGNLEDISARALRTLREVALIAAEDTRRTRVLLQHYEIDTRLTSYHEHNEESKTRTLVEVLEQGDLALVSDAGTPLLNDPGFELVRAALERGHTVTSIPGPSAPLSALVLSGFRPDQFLYLGYLPRRAADRRNLLKDVEGLPYTLIFLETPHRLTKALADLAAVLGDRPVAVARELTKLHEEVFRGRLTEARKHFDAQPPRGEITLVIGPAPEKTTLWEPGRLRAAAKKLLTSGRPPSEVARDLSGESGWRRRDVYQVVVELTGKQKVD